MLSDNYFFLILPNLLVFPISYVLKKYILNWWTFNLLKLCFLLLFFLPFNPPTLIIAILSILLILVVLLSKNQIFNLNTIKRLLVISWIAIFLSFYWSITLIKSFTLATVNNFNDAAVETPELTNLNSTYARVLQWLWQRSFGVYRWPDRPNYSYQRFFEYPIIDFILYIPLILMFYMVFRKKPDKTTIILTLIYLIFIPIVVWIREWIFSNIYQLLYNSSSFFIAFRNWFKWQPFISLCLWLVVIINIKHLTNKSKTIFLFSLIIYFFAITYPYYTFTVIWNQKKLKIPNAYIDKIQLSNWSYRIFSLPKEYFEVYNWWKGWSISYSLNKQLIKPVPWPSDVYANIIYENVYQSLINKDKKELNQLYNKYNIKYILVKEDVDRLKNINLTNNLQFNLSLVSWLKLEKVIGDRKLFETWYVWPILFSDKISSVFLKWNPIKYLINIKSNWTLDINNLNFLQSFHSERKLYPWIKNNIQNCENKILHTWNNLLDNWYTLKRWTTNECIWSWYTFFNWDELSYLRKKPLRSKNHTMVFDYANRWEINLKMKNESGKTYLEQWLNEWRIKQNLDWTYDISLVLYFRPQSRFYLGLIISWSTLLWILFRLGRNFRKRKTLISL
jgi:hypothetical protein